MDRPTPPSRTRIVECPENRLLGALSEDEYRRLKAFLEPVALVPGRVLYEEGEAIEWVVFPHRGLVSLIVRLVDGRSVEAAAVGREGVVGLPAVLAQAPSSVQAVAPIGGAGVRLPAARLRRELTLGGRLRTLFERYANSVQSVAGQSIACTRFHGIEKRCARWLLGASDSLSEDTFKLTHDLLAATLGVRRAGVSEAVSSLEKRGLIRSGRGRFTLTNRPGLEGFACECYRMARQELENVYA